MLAGCGGGGGGGSFRFTSTPTTSAPIRVEYAYALQTADADGAVALSLVQAPAGATLGGDGVVRFTPQYADLGEHAFTVRATDATDSVDQSFALRVHQGMLLGVALSPRGHTGSSQAQDYVDHLQGDSPHGRSRGFHGNWRDAVADDGEIPQLFVAAQTFAADYGCQPTLVVGWADGAGAPDLTSESAPGDNGWGNAETRNEFLAMVTALADSRKPPYLFLGNEVNAYFVTHTQVDWDLWIGEYEACYDAIKQVSPDTMVGMTFQLEMLKGLGGNTGWSYPQQWAIVDALIAGGKVDLLGFTSYPYLHYDALVDVPFDYYDEIALHWTGPVAFSEIGWLAAPHTPYPGGETAQADFVSTFFAQTDDLELEYVNWLFLHDFDGQAALPAFADIGLRNNDASVIRAADAVWQAAVALRQR